MSSNASEIQHLPPVQTTFSPSAANPTTAAATAASNANSASLTKSTKLGSIDDLKNKAPELWNAMLMGIARSICSEMKKSQDRTKKLNKSYNV